MRSGNFTPGGFYIRRARRILPALAVTLAGTLAIGWEILLPLPYQTLGLHAVAGASFFSNFVFWNEVGYFNPAADTKPLLHLWSLGVEEQFYLVWPILLMILSKRPKTVIASLCAIVSVIIYLQLLRDDLLACRRFLLSLVAVMGTWDRWHPVFACRPHLEQQPAVVCGDRANRCERTVAR